MKRILMLSALTGVLTLTGCSTMDKVFGTNMSGMNDVKAVTSSTVPVTSRNGMLVDSTKYMTLYTFDKDMANKSNCTGECLAAWPALTAPSNVAASGQFSTFQRDDGSYQWAVNNKPLYFFVKDTKAGDKNGDNVKNVWHIVPTK